MDIAKAHFLFGPDFDPAGGLDPQDAEDREKLFADSPEGWAEEDLGWLEALARQIADEDPPEVWATAQRLLADGLDRTDVLDQLTLALSTAEQQAADAERDIDVPGYVASLAWLPVPEPQEIRGAVAQILMQAKFGCTEEECATQVSRKLDRAPDDALMRSVTLETIHEMVSEEELESLADGRVLFATEAIEGSMFTHRLTAAELALGRLGLDDFVGHREPWIFEEDEEFALVDDDDGVTRLEGPEGWLDDFKAGDLIGLRFEDGVPVEVRVNIPPPDPEFLDRVRAAYAAEAARFGLPVPLSRIALSLIVENPQTFIWPQAPLSELCAAIGVEVRGDLAADHPKQWQMRRYLRWTAAALQEFDAPEDLNALLSAFALVERPESTPDLIRRVLEDLEEPERAMFFAIQLGGWDDAEAEPTRSLFAERLLQAARKPGQEAVALWLASVMAEARGDVLAAEAHVRRAVAGLPPWPLALEWAGWYASDRGNAAEAVGYWRRLDPLPTEDLAAVEPFAQADPADLGRNDPCWCGSGKKFKACHLGQPALAPLPQRARWLYRKAWFYFTRTGENSFADLLRYGEAAAVDPMDPASIRAGAQDPLTIDVVMAEGGWFARFLAARGPLLPRDEAELAAHWVEAERTLYEVVGAQAGRWIDLVDLRTDETVRVREDVWSREAVAGTLVCTRTVPDSELRVFAGPLITVPEHYRDLFLLTCESGDGFGICQLYAAGKRAAQPPAADSG